MRLVKGASPVAQGGGPQRGVARRGRPRSRKKCGRPREYLSTGYGLQFSAEVDGSKQEKTNTYRKPVLLQNSEISGNLREFTE